MRFRTLFLFLFPTLLASRSMAATINLSPGQDVIDTIAAASAGDTVVLGAGTYNINSPITVPSGVTVAGASLSSTHVVFNLAGGDTTSYGMTIAGNASNVTIEQIDMYSNHGLIQMSLGDPYTDHFTNIVITRNNFEYGGGQLSDGTLVFGIFGSMINDGLQITHNYFHDSTGVGTRNWCIWSATNANLDYNVFYNITDGGQISQPGPNVSFSYNYGTHINRMGQEAGLNEQSSLTIIGNVFFDWINPYPNSDALSIIGPAGQVDYTNNYFRASMAPGSSWGPPDGGGLNRFGIAIEGTGQPANVTGNTFVGEWACDYCSTMVNANVSGNTVWGGAIWGDFGEEGGPFGEGSVNASNNTLHQSGSGAPNPPANTFAGPDNAEPVETSPPASSNGSSSAGQSTPAQSAKPVSTSSASTPAASTPVDSSTSTAAPVATAAPAKSTTPLTTASTPSATKSAAPAAAVSKPVPKIPAPPTSPAVAEERVSAEKLKVVKEKLDKAEKLEKAKKAAKAEELFEEETKAATTKPAEAGGGK